MPDSAEIGDTYNADLLIDNNSIVEEVIIPIMVTIVSTVQEDEIPVPMEYALYQNYPNPFNPTTTIGFDLRERSHVVLEIYNVLGQRVASLVDRTMNAGRYSLNFNASRLATGIYFYRITAGDFTNLKKMVLIK